MNLERTGPRIHPDYASALGLAVYSFASLEWAAVCCCERLEAGSIDRLEDRTAGRVADTLLRLVNELEPSTHRGEMQVAATDFRFLVSTRNNLVHAKPGTAADGSQGLFRHGDHWTTAELQAVADSFNRCRLRLDNSLLGITSECRHTQV
jgi:hypothetical protein